MSTETQKRVEISRCPDCGEKVRIEGKIFVGREVVCPECDAVLEIIDTEPVELDWAYEDDDEDEEDEDW